MLESTWVGGGRGGGRGEEERGKGRGGWKGRSDCHVLLSLYLHVTKEFTSCASLMATSMVAFLLLTKHRQVQCVCVCVCVCV